MAYLSQTDAQLHEARRLFAHAEQAEKNWPYCGHLLARVLEHATCAVFLAWDEPHAAERKMHRFFDERLAPHLDPDVVQLVQLVWSREGQGAPADQVEQLLAASREAIDYFADVAAGPPPADWEPQPIPTPLAWNELSHENRQFLEQAISAAVQQVPGVRLILFGSQAAGTAGPDSDCDLFFIFPNQTAEWQRGQAIGPVSCLATDHGIELSVERASEADWLDPPEVSRPLIERVKATGIEIPLSPPGCLG
jgi:hypothetical protein